MNQGMQLVIFDMDGVLIDSEPIYKECNQSIYKELGINISSEEYNSFIGIASDKKWSYIQDKFGLSESVIDLMQLSKRTKYQRLSKMDLSPIEGVSELLKAIKKCGIKIALASSSSWNLIHLITQKTGLKVFFDLMVSGEDIKNGKPAPDIFLKAAKDANANPLRCVVIEDSKNGVLATKAARMTSVGILRPPSVQDLTKADIVIKEYSEQSINLITSLL